MDALQLAVARGRDAEDTLPHGDVPMEDLVSELQAPPLVSPPLFPPLCRERTRLLREADRWFLKWTDGEHTLFPASALDFVAASGAAKSKKKKRD